MSKKPRQLDVCDHVTINDDPQKKIYSIADLFDTHTSVSKNVWQVTRVAELWITEQGRKRTRTVPLTKLRFAA